MDFLIGIGAGTIIAVLLLILHSLEGIRLILGANMPTLTEAVATVTSEFAELKTAILNVIADLEGSADVPAAIASLTTVAEGIDSVTATLEAADPTPGG